MSGSMKLSEMESQCVVAAHVVVQQLFDRNRSTWDALDRETVFVLRALIAAYLNKK